MYDRFPRPQDVGVRVPRSLKEDRFCAGFEHALRGGQLTRAQHLRRSFRLGYRAAKLYLHGVRRHRGILSFPLRGRFRVKAVSGPARRS